MLRRCPRRKWKRPAALPDNGCRNPAYPFHRVGGAWLLPTRTADRRLPYSRFLPFGLNPRRSRIRGPPPIGLPASASCPFRLVFGVLCFGCCCWLGSFETVFLF